MTKFLFYGMIWGIMIGYFYIVNITKISHKLLTSLMMACYYIYFKASYVKGNEKIVCIRDGIDPIFKSLNIKINKFGYTNNNRPTLYISNHQSYLDSLILKYLKPNVKTIAKSDVIGDFSIMQTFAKTILDNWGVIYYTRGDKKSGSNVRNLIKESILNGSSVLVYPEGTSYTFNGLHKFYPGSFEVAFENNINIQPITIKYETDITWGAKDVFTKKYHTDMIANAEQCQKIKENNINITFHPLLDSSKFESAEHLLNYTKFVITDEWIHQHHYLTNSHAISTSALSNATGAIPNVPIAECV